MQPLTALQSKARAPILGTMPIRKQNEKKPRKPRRTRAQIQADEQREREERDSQVVKVVPRPHQSEAHAAFKAGQRDQYHIWHRRAGKDWFGIDVAREMMRQEVGTYWHLLPKHVQARRALWSGIDHQSGRRFMDIFFPDAVAINNTEMLVESAEGSTWQLLGSDNYDRMIGSNPRGVVISEWALCDPRAYDYIRPILRANKGWVIFITTFRGRNHAYRMYNELKDRSDWYVTKKTVLDTKLISEEDIQKDRETGMSERLIRQEYYCEPAPPASLGPYARVFDALDKGNRIFTLPETARTAATYYAVAEFNGYTALVECAMRGAEAYFFGGDVVRDIGVHEILGPRITGIRQGHTTLSTSETLQREVMSTGLPAVLRRPATTVSTSNLLERAIISPNSVVAAALTASVDTFLKGDDDEHDLGAATTAVYTALEQLTASLGESSTQWGPPPNYAKHDLAVIGRR